MNLPLDLPPLLLSGERAETILAALELLMVGAAQQDRLELAEVCNLLRAGLGLDQKDYQPKE